jgi:hypothetical protein
LWAEAVTLAPVLGYTISEDARPFTTIDTDRFVMTTEGHFVPLVNPNFNYTMGVGVPVEERKYVCENFNATEVERFINFNFLPYLEIHG